MLVTLDFETYYDTKVSLTKMSTMEYVRHPMFKVWGVGIKIDDGEPEWFSEDEVTDALMEVCWDDASLLCQNTPFDGYILSQVYGILPKFYLDTAAMSRGLFPGQSSSLKAIAERLFPEDEEMRKGDDLVKAKGLVDLPPDVEADLARYCLKDVELTYEIYQRWHADYPPSELALIDLTTRMFCDPVIKIDRERLSKYHESEYERAQKLIEDSGLEREVLTSNDKFAEHLQSLGITPPTKVSPATGELIPAFGKNDAGWRQLCKMYPEHQHLWSARIAAKSRIAETRAKRFLDAAGDDDRISVPLRYYAAHTGRFGGTEKLNMQNLPRGGELRKCLVAPEGSLIYVADLSNIEARMLAWMAYEDNLLEMFRQQVDVYCEFASKIYSREITKEENPTERFVGKTAILGLGYGMGHNKFRMTLESGAAGPALQIPEAQARQVVNTYRSTYIQIPRLWVRMEALLRQSMNPINEGVTYRDVLTVTKNGLLLPNGMALRYEGLRVGSGDSLEYFNKGKKETTYGGRITENVVQALARIVITDSMLRLDKRFQGRGRVALTVHDEVVIIAANTDPGATMQEIIDDLCQPPSWAPDLPLAAEGGYDTRYSK